MERCYTFPRDQLRISDSGLGCLFKTWVTITGYYYYRCCGISKYFTGVSAQLQYWQQHLISVCPYCLRSDSFCQYVLLTMMHKHKYNKHKDNRGISQGGIESVATLNHLPPCEAWVTTWCSGLLLRKHRPDIFTGFLLVSRSGGERVRGKGVRRRRGREGQNKSTPYVRQKRNAVTVADGPRRCCVH